MSESIIARFRWTRKEFIKAQQFHHRLKLRRGVLGFAQIVFGLIFVLLGTAFAFWLWEPSGSAPPYWAFLMFAAVFAFLILYDKINAWQWGRNFDKLPGANIDVEMHFSPDGIRTKSELGDGLVYWKAILKVVETSDSFMLSMSPKFFLWLPFSAFESQDGSAGS